MRIINLSVLGLATAVSNAGIRKVVDLLEGMKATIEKETAEAKSEQRENADWCIKTIADTQQDISYGAQKVEELNAIAEDGAAQAAAKAAEAAECAESIGASQAKQGEAKAARKEEHRTFEAKEAELVEADTMLGKAYSVLKRSLALMQDGNLRAAKETYTAEVVAALGQIIESAWVDSGSSKQLTAFLEDSDSLSMHQPQASVSKYESKSGGILDAIQSMQEKNAQTLAGVREGEMRARHAFEMQLQDLKNIEENKSEQMDAAKGTGAKAGAKGKEAEAGAAEAADTLAADKRELAETKASCNKAARTFAQREKDAIEEMGVIAKAVEILTGKFGRNSFLQISHSSSEEESQFARRNKVSQILQKLGRTYNQFALIQAAQSAQADTFDKIRGMISDMITRLEEEQRKEGDKEAKCVADKAKGAKDLKIKTSQWQKLLSRSDGAKAKIAKTQSEISDLNGQLQDLAASVAEAVNMRNKEKASNEATIQESTESIESLSLAIKTLTDYYGASEALLQMDQPSKGDQASLIISVLQTAQEDFEKLKQETEMAESSASEEHDDFLQDSEVAKTKKTALVEGKTNEVASVNVQLSQISDDLVDAEKALDAASTFLKQTNEACANKSMSFEERQQRRAAEIAGLHDAMEILSPEESFLQTSSFMARRSL